MRVPRAKKKVQRNLTPPNSLTEEKEQQQKRQEEVPREIDWKKQQQQQQQRISTKEVEEEVDGIGISGSKVGEGALARDVRRLKSATLDRMGKMLKIHSKSSDEKPDELTASANWRGEEPSRKQKFNSLTRMLRFSDKEDKSKSLGEYRGRSLTRILRRKVPIEGDNPADKPDEHVRGIFSRIIGQIRGRMFKADSNNENSSQINKEDSVLSSKLSSSGIELSELNLDSSCPVANARHDD